MAKPTLAAIEQAHAAIVICWHQLDTLDRAGRGLPSGEYAPTGDGGTLFYPKDGTQTDLEQRIMERVRIAAQAVADTARKCVKLHAAAIDFIDRAVMLFGDPVNIPPDDLVPAASLHRLALRLAADAAAVAEMTVPELMGKAYLIRPAGDYSANKVLTQISLDRLRLELNWARRLWASPEHDDSRTKSITVRPDGAVYPTHWVLAYTSSATAPLPDDAKGIHKELVRAGGGWHNFHYYAANRCSGTVASQLALLANASRASRLEQTHLKQFRGAITPIVEWAGEKWPSYHEAAYWANFWRFVDLAQRLEITEMSNDTDLEAAAERLKAKWNDICDKWAFPIANFEELHRWLRAEWEAVQARGNVSVADTRDTQPTGPAENVILWHGGTKYSIGDSGPITLYDETHDVLQAFMASPSMDTPALTKALAAAKSKCADPVRIIRGLQENRKGLFAPAISRPADRGEKRGPYRIRVQRADQQAS